MNNPSGNNNTSPKKKVFNDPLYGLINFPYEILYKLIDHPYIQRLRRIKQLGLTDYVYSGGSHSRFNHCLGALHLMTEAIQILRWKGVEVTDEEAEAVSIAILLHDVGHGPFSHALEGLIMPFHHEDLSIRIMEMLDEEFNGALQLAIKIFTRQYKKPFLQQLVSSQIDMDRMDYLNRDSFYSGVVEGMIGYERIIKMMNVVDNQLVIEEKGVLSVEQFLMARRMMYWQVYLHKTVLAAEKMLQQFFKLIRKNGYQNYQESIPAPLDYFFREFESVSSFDRAPAEAVKRFMALDDTDIIFMLKSFAKDQEDASQLLAKGILDRHIFKIILKNRPISRDFVKIIRHNIEKHIDLKFLDADALIISGSESNATYQRNLDEIFIQMKNGNVKPFAKVQDIVVSTKTTEKHFIIFPRVAGIHI